MSVTRPITLHCDSRPCDVQIETGSQVLGKARRVAWEAGWEYRRRLDWCPRHSLREA